MEQVNTLDASIWCWRDSWKTKEPYWLKIILPCPQMSWSHIKLLMQIFQGGALGYVNTNSFSWYAVRSSCRVAIFQRMHSWNPGGVYILSESCLEGNMIRAIYIVQLSCNTTQCHVVAKYFLFFSYHIHMLITRDCCYLLIFHFNFWNKRN